VRRSWIEHSEIRGHAERDEAAIQWPESGLVLIVDEASRSVTLQVDGRPALAWQLAP
jgi:hypothetical protein